MELYLNHYTLTVSNTCFDGGYNWYYQSDATVTSSSIYSTCDTNTGYSTTEE